VGKQTWSTRASLFEIFLLASGFCALTICPPISASEAADSTSVSVHESLLQEASAVGPLIQSQLGRRMLEAVASLPTLEKPRTLHTNAATKTVLNEMEAANLPESLKNNFEAKDRDEEFYYYTGYGTPLAAVHAYDLVAEQGLPPADKLRIIEFGYGSIGQLRLLASLGADVFGIEVSKTLRALYSYPGDTGDIAAASVEGARPGHLTLLNGHFPGDTALTNQLKGKYDIFLSKNTLKRGYIHPEREVDPRMLVHLGVDDTTFVTDVYDLLKPGGYFMIYNLHPKLTGPDAEKYIPWSDGRSPFDRKLLETVGFEIIDFDRDDTAFARRMAVAFGWDKEMDLENDLFGMYTLLRKK
jgi:hypothetical protein